MTMRWAIVAAVLAVQVAAFGKEDPKKPHTGSSAQPMSPQESQKRFKVPAGFEVRLFAAEPDVVNPVAMSFDEKGRLWVVELYEYPNGAKKGTRGRDRVKVLEDTDGDGRADKVTLFCDGLSLATAILPGNGGVYVGQAPDLYFYPIVSDGPNGPKAGERRTVLTGFGMEDRHELLNSFCWGPDGWMYFTHGVFTHSLVKDPSNPAGPGVKIDAAVVRYNPRTRKVERFSDGISNQWGVDWDREGNAFVSACVVDHIWHTAPGGVYIRQGGTPNVPYTYDLLKPINKDRHRHYMAAYGGINVYQGDLFPSEYRGTVFMGNIHGNCLDHDRLTPDGASFAATDLRKASDQGEWLEANDDWFRPVSEQVGPDGALWVMDWYDKYPCYQNSQAPDLDRERGRIWRVVYVGEEKGKAIPPRRPGIDPSTMDARGLVGLLSHPNVWYRRTAQRLLVERPNHPVDAIRDVLLASKSFDARMAALWTLGAVGELDDSLLDRMASDRERAVRMWAARFTAERGQGTPSASARLARLAADAEPAVRAEVASALRRLPIAQPMPIVATLLKQPATNTDPILPFLIWMAAEPQVPIATQSVLDTLHESRALPAAPAFARKAFHRIADTKDPVKLDLAVAFLRKLQEPDAALARAAMDGILDSKQPVAPASGFDDVIAALQTRDPETSSRAARLANLWGNAAAATRLLKSIDDPAASEPDRLRGVRIAAEVKGDTARKSLLAALPINGTETFKLEVIRALGEVGGGPEVADAILKQWKTLSVDSRRAAAEVMAARLPWARRLLEETKSKAVSSTDIPLTAHRTMARHKDEEFTALMVTAIGPFRESTAERAALIQQKKLAVLNGPVDLQAGHAVMAKTCLVCHQFYGEGANPSVGPDLTGVGRSSFDALLANVIDPNQIIGKGYENTVVTRKDGDLVTGRLVEENDDMIKLLAQGPVEHAIPRKQIKSIRTENISVMPEGLEQVPEADFRNLLWYVFSPPQDDRQRRVKVELSAGRILIKAKRPGADQLTDLMIYTLNPGAHPQITSLRDPAGKELLEGAAISAGSPSSHFVRVTDLQETNDRASVRTLLEAGNTQEEQEITVYALSDPGYYRIDLEWRARGKSSARIQLPGARGSTIASSTDLTRDTVGIAVLGGSVNVEGDTATVAAKAAPDGTRRIRLLVHQGPLDAKVIAAEQP